eukprot:IDg22864t1
MLEAMLQNNVFHSLERHAKAVELYRNLDVEPSERSRVFWGWVLSIYSLCLNKQGRVLALKLPAFPEKTFCQAAWLQLMDIKPSAFGYIKKEF